MSMTRRTSRSAERHRQAPLDVACTAREFVVATKLCGCIRHRIERPHDEVLDLLDHVAPATIAIVAAFAAFMLTLAYAERTSGRK